ncbi:TRAP transporter permease [Selenomonas sp. TAMA-11512]|uniref:TRAP transporter permease n=1 Tax=Selenomonas sp. TAMA-11512 TaxID=3095337 RepID=UPI00308497CC|nr:TRAP transporter permease [Selenomonas sp. TAMA-11512]
MTNTPSAEARTKAEEALKKYDRESNTIEHDGWIGKGITLVAIIFSLFQVYTALFGVLDAHIQRAVHLGFGLFLVYLLYPMRQSWSRKSLHTVDVIFAFLGAAAPLYIVASYESLVLRAGSTTNIDLVFGIIGLLLVIEAARRVVGMPMVTVVLLFLAYAFLGPYMPSLLAHRGLNLEQLVSHLFFTTEGVFGIPLGVSSTFIFLFILFGAYLEATGLGHFFIDIANAVAGWARGGPAKVAVLSSGLMGTVSGSSVANVAGTGSFTIPMMMKLGYNKNFAGAVEAAASTGGQLMPPVMGAAAFLMAEFVGVPYVEVVAAATIPALLYFTGIWIGVHLEARRSNLKGIPRNELPSAMNILKERGHLAIPLIVIVYLLVSGYTPMKAALWAIILSILAASLRASTRMSPREIIHGLELGAKNVLGVLVACAAAGIIIGVVTKTGVGLKLASALLQLSGGMLLPTLFFTMITSIILGMGVPTTANYVITSTIAAPALIQMGVPILAAHMFVFYFGIIADVTPPVALAAFAGSAISGGNPLRTGVNASKLAIAAFIIPYIFVLSPQILMINPTPLGVAHILITALIGMIGISASLIGCLLVPTTMLERVLLFFGGLLLVHSGLTTDIIGFALLFFGILSQYKTRKKLPQA